MRSILRSPGRLLLLLGLAFTFNATSQVFITEVADPNNSAGSRFVELYNAGGSAVDLTGWTLQIYSNGGGTASATNNLTGSIPAGGFFILADNNTTFTSTFGFAADQDGVVSGNGNDTYVLNSAVPAIVDLFGSIGVDGAGTCADIEDGRAERMASVTVGNTSFTGSEWNVWNDGPPGAVCTSIVHTAQDAPGIFDPGSWIGAGGPSCGITLGAEGAVCNSQTAGPGNDTYDLSIPYTGMDAGTAVVNNSGSGSIGGDDPAVTSDGTIVISGISEDDAYNVTFTSPCDALVVSGAAPSCEPAPSVALVINEILADPDLTLGDANGDGSVNTAQDEFVEIVNNGATDVDLTGWTVSDGVSVRHTFPGGSVVSAGCAVVVFAGGTPTGGFGGALVQTASSGGLGLNNTGDDVTLADDLANVVASYTYGGEGGNNESLTRNPDITGADPLVLHSLATGSGGSVFSPGTRVDGSSFSGCSAPPACGISLGAENAVCNSQTAGPGNDTYDLSIPYTGMDAGTTVVNNSGSGSVGGDDPAVTSNGTIVITGISEDDAYSVTFTIPCDALTVSGSAPSCEPAPAGMVIHFDDALLWTAGSASITSYASDHTYVEGDWSFTGGPALRQGTATQDGFPGALDTYAWRLQNNSSVDWRATYNGSEVIDAFGFSVRRWDDSPSPAFEVSYSMDGGSSFGAAVQVIDNTYLGNSSDWTVFSYVVPAPTAVAAGQFVVRVAATGTTERIMIDDFTFETSPLPPGAGIVINEVDADSPGSDVAEFVELFGPANAPLDGLVLVFFNGNGDVSYAAFDLDTYSLDANGFFVVGNGAVPNVGLTFGDNLLQNGADAVALYVGDATDFPNGTAVTTTDLVDALVYDTNDADDAGLLVLTPGQPQVNEGGGTGSADESNSRFPDGGAPQVTTTYVQQAPTPGTTNVGGCGVIFQPETATCNSQNPGPGNDTYDLSIPYSGVQAGVSVINNSGSGIVGGDDPAVTANGTILITGISEDDNYDVALSAPCALVTLTGQAPVCEPAIDYTVLVINEVDYDQAGTDTTEFVEIKNTGLTDINVGGVQLQLINGNGGAPYLTVLLNNTVVPAGGYYVVGSANVPNVDQVEWTSNGIQNGAPDGVALLDPSNTLIDAVTYEGDIPGYTEGSGAGLEDNTTGLPDYNSFSLSRFPDGVDTDQNDIDFLVKCITPGASNSAQDDFCACGPATASVSTQCIDEFTFNIQVNVTDLGTSSIVIVTDDLNGYLDLVFAPGTVVLGPFNNNDVVTVNLLHETNTLCDVAIAGITEDCTPAGPCLDNEMTLTIATDDFPDEITWEVTPAGGGTAVCSGGPYFVDFNTEIETCCLPDGCYDLTFFDSFGDGIDAPGGYVLTDPDGKRVLISDGSYASTGMAAQAFCVPIGAVSITAINCDREDFLITEAIECSSDAAVTAEWQVGDQTDDGYQFWFFDADGGFSRRIFRSHAASGGFGPANATRACRLKLSSMVTNPLPFDVLLNARVRPRVNGVYGEFGPSCRFRLLGAPPACPTTNLVDFPGQSTFSCGVTRSFGGSDKIYAQPVAGATNYKFRFEYAPEGFLRNIAVPSPGLVLNWVTLPLQDGVTYDVTVAVSLDGGGTYCPFGDLCQVIISNPPSAGARSVQVSEMEMSMWPNPNRGDLLYLTIPELPEDAVTVTVDIHDLAGRRAVTRTMTAQGGSLNTTIPLEGGLATGMYIVNIKAGAHQFTDRLVIE